MPVPMRSDGSSLELDSLLLRVDWLREHFQPPPPEDDVLLLEDEDEDEEELECLDEVHTPK